MDGGMLNNMISKLHFEGGVGTATGAQFLLECESPSGVYRIVVDCGLLQGVQESDEFNHAAFSYDPSTIDVVCVTHAHADHIGRIPKLVKDGFTGVIYSTPATQDLARVMLDDQCNIMAHNAQTKQEEPLYGKQDVQKAFTLWKTVPYHTMHEIGPGITMYCKDAGHILGSAMIELSRNGRKIVFTGDLGNSPSLFLRDTETVTDAHYMVMESVYGDRNHESKETRRAKLTRIIKTTIAEKRTLIIPVFSLERTQDVLYEINDLVESGGIKPIPVFIDSPLAIKVTDIYKKWVSEYKEDIQKRIAGGDDVFDFAKLKATARTEDSMRIQDIANPKIILAGSGMSAGGRIVAHEKHFLPDPHATILFVGYQAAGTLGRKIQEGGRVVTIHGEEVVVRARIESVNGYSSHKDSDHLIEFVDKASASLKTVFVAMGEPKSSMFLAQRLRDYIGVKAVYPERGSIHVLEF